MSSMSPKISINGPYRNRKRPKARLLESDAYMVMAAFAGVAYVLYMFLVG